jgi:epoxyqueuosine reductase
LACPTGALDMEGNFFPKKCINFYNIESKEPVPEEIAKQIGNKLFGCDDCIVSCPIHQKAPPCDNKELNYHDDIEYVPISEIILYYAGDVFQSFQASSFNGCFAEFSIELVPVHFNNFKSKIKS